MASLFKPEVKSEILAKSPGSAKDSSRNRSGLFGGNAKIRAALIKATKNDVVLKKAARYGRKRKNSSFILWIEIVLHCTRDLYFIFLSL